MKRKLRTPENVDEILGRDPELQSLRSALEKIDNVIVQPDGKGKCVFKVYFLDRTGQFESFLWLHTPFNESLVSWGNQPENAIEFYKSLWQPHVISTDKSGTKVKRDISVETIVRIVEQYVHHCFPLIPPKAIDFEPPSPERVKTTTNRIIRDTALAQQIKALHKYECQICSLTIDLLDGTRYAEAHHIKPLGSPHNGLVPIRKPLRVAM